MTTALFLGLTGAVATVLFYALIWEIMRRASPAAMLVAFVGTPVLVCTVPLLVLAPTWGAALQMAAQLMPVAIGTRCLLRLVLRLQR